MPACLSFRFDEATAAAGLDCTLNTALGPLELLGGIVGGGRWEALRDHVVEASAFGVTFSGADLPWLIQIKRAAGRPRDLEVVAELEQILAEGQGD